MPGKKSDHLQGGKYTASHTTVIQAARGPVQAAEKLPSVNKVSLGIIKQIAKGPLSIKFQDLGPTCFLAKIRGATSIQEVRVFTSDMEEAKKAMTKALTF